MPVPPPANAKKVFEAPMHTLYLWQQQMFDGSEATFECITRPDTTTVIPFLDRDTVLLIKQQQPQNPKPFWDVPGGRVDTGETMEQAVIRELFEEAGYRAKQIELWQNFVHADKIRFEQGVYIATDLTLDTSAHHNDNGERTELIPTKWTDLVQMCLERKLRQPEVMLCILGMHYDPPQRARLDAFLDRG